MYKIEKRRCLTEYHDESSLKQRKISINKMFRCSTLHIYTVLTAIESGQIGFDSKVHVKN